MIPAEVMTATCASQSRSALGARSACGLDLQQGLFDYLDGVVATYRRRLIRRGDAGRGGEDVRIANDGLGHGIARIAELCGDLGPGQTLQKDGVIARGVQREHPPDVDEWELAGL